VKDQSPEISFSKKGSEIILRFVLAKLNEKLLLNWSALLELLSNFSSDKEPHQGIVIRTAMAHDLFSSTTEEYFKKCFPSK